MNTGTQPPPIVKAFLLCRGAGIDAKNQLILIDPTVSFRVQAVPITLQLAVYMRLTAVHTDFQISLNLTNPDGSPGDVVELPSQTGHRDPFGSPGYCWQGMPFHFPQPGRYELAVVIDGREAYSDSLLLSLHNAAPMQQPPQAHP